jgi:hypothetical protein
LSVVVRDSPGLSAADRQCQRECDVNHILARSVGPLAQALPATPCGRRVRRLGGMTDAARHPALARAIMTTAASRSGKYLATAAVSAEQWPVGISAFLRCVAEIALNYDQGGACGAAGPASAAASGLGGPRPPHAGPHRETRQINQAHSPRRLDSAHSRPSPSWHSAQHPGTMGRARPIGGLCEPP